MTNVYTAADLAAAPMTTQRQRNTAPSSWFEALSDAWGASLDNQAQKIETQALQVRNGNDNPSQLTELTAESLRMGFLANSSSTSLDSVGKALETMARKG